MKKQRNNRQLIIIGTLVGTIIFTLETVIDLLVGSTLTIWIILGYLMLKLMKLKQLRKKNIHEIE